MTLFSRTLLVQLLIFLLITQGSYFIEAARTHEPVSASLRHIKSRETIINPKSYNEPASNYQKQAHYLSSNQQQVTLPSYLRAAGLILPANNQAEVNNFKELYNFNNPSAKLHQLNNQTPGINAPYVDHFASTPAPITSSRDELSPAFSSRSVLKTINLNQTTDLSNLHGGSILEMAMRQVNSDEGMFHSPPALIAPTSHNFDWPVGNRQPATALNSSPTNNLKMSDSNTVSPILTSTTTTDQSNNILGHFSADYSTATIPIESKGETSYDPMLFTSGNQTPTSSNLGSHLNEHQQSNGSTVELPNHVFYEGPATAPPIGNYFFSSSEKLPNNDERASNAWWLLGFGHEFERASNLTRDDYREYCASSEVLVSNKQRSLCKLHPKVMPIVARGIKMAIDECQSRFSTNRWNCSLVLQNSLSVVDQQSSNQLFGDVMKQPNRERSFLNAIIAAGLSHTMTKACSQGELPEECSCDKKIKSKNNRGKIEWVACSDDIDFGARFSRDFTDQADNESDATSMINVHNYEVGRRVFKSATDITCTCQNGENGLCQTKKCWKHLGSFTDIGDELIRRYESATHVQMSTKDPHKLRPVRRGVRKPKRKDLVYIDESPDYCSPNTRLGVLGTQNRRCNSTSIGSDSCSLLCCGRGYQVFVEEVEEDCNCKFVWCCQVKCEKCRRQIINDVCN